ncbi:MAG: diacylglycerol kinase family protein [Anaerolineales bacterium]
MTMRGLLIYNPMAGKFPSQPLVERAARILTSNGWEVDIQVTTGENDITKMAKRAARKGMNAVFVAGGDGSIHKAVAGLLGSETSLAVLPCGTANVWAQELGLPTLSWTNWLALENSVQKLLNGHVHTMDVGICQDIPFLLWSGIGIDAFLVHHLEPRSRFAKQFPVTQGVANLAWYAPTWSGMDLDIWVDGDKFEGKFILALVTNIHLYAGGLAEISPKARLDDGRMDLWLFSGDSLLETFQHVVDLASGRHLDSSKTMQISCQEIKIKSAAELYLQLDGEPIIPSRSITISIQPLSLKVMVPETMPRALFTSKAL